MSGRTNPHVRKTDGRRSAETVVGRKRPRCEHTQEDSMKAVPPLHGTLEAPPLRAEGIDDVLHRDIENSRSVLIPPDRGGLILRLLSLECALGSSNLP